MLAQQYLAAGAWEEALEICRALSDGGAQQHLGLLLCEARARFGLGERGRALDIVLALRAQRPDDPVCAFYLAQLLAHAGEAAAAVRAFHDVIQIAPDYPGALPALAQLTLPGPPYREVLRRLHAALAPRTYLEIGVEYGATLQLARNSSIVIGVDPVLRQSPHELPPSARLFEMTSDAFFARYQPSELLGEARVDLAFIDGMHWFEVALRDLQHVERWCRPGSVLVMHDCLPAHEVAARRDRVTRFWVGDAWKALEYVLQHRRDLRAWIVPCYPSGLVVLQSLGNLPVPAEPLPEFISQHMARPYPYASGAWPSHYPILPNTDAGLRELVTALLRGGGGP